MSGQSARVLDAIPWVPQPEAAALVAELVESICEQCEAVRSLAGRMQNETGTRLADWIDHLAFLSQKDFETRLGSAGFVAADDGPRKIWRHPRGLFPRIITDGQPTRRIALKVEAVAAFLAAHRLGHDTQIEGISGAPLRRAMVAAEDDTQLWVVERHGWAGFEPPEVSQDQVRIATVHRDALVRRKRTFDRDALAFEHASQLIRAAVADLGTDWACDLFFAAERQYWQGRNRAAQVQKDRQDQLGLGWANHDHHTYRSSRAQFARLVAVLERLGLVCRERFYAGREAGWGAQVLEQPVCGIVVFADVDLTAEEVAGDFAHAGLAPQSQLATVGLWCRLHGEAFLAAGLHHLECEFDFDAAREQLRTAGIETMTPFSDLPYLRQAFTAGEAWPVEPERVDAALSEGAITSDEAARFRQAGALGSHLEILQRNDGYKGFNQSGINDIIRQTDPRWRA